MYNLLCDEKNIDSIFFYAINNDLNCLGFHYTANNKKYKKDYKDIDFKESVIRIKKVYEILKDKNKINLIGDLTKDIIEGKINIETNRIYNKTLLNNDKYDYLSMLDYINFIINHTLNMLHSKNNDNIEYCLPISFYKTDNGYKFKYRIVNENVDYIFDCDINIFDKSIVVRINNPIYSGEIIFDRLNIDNEISFKKDGNNIYYKNYDNTLNEEDKNKIKKVFDMLDINYEIDGIKTMDDNYILYNSSDEYDYFIKLSIHDDLIRVSLKSSNKYVKKDIDFRTDEEKYDILITKYNKDYLLVQKKYLMTLNGSNDFKQNINKSRYFILKRDNLGNIIDSNILNKEEALININDLEDINKLILKRD